VELVALKAAIEQMISSVPWKSQADFVQKEMHGVGCHSCLRSDPESFTHYFQ